MKRLFRGLRRRPPAERYDAVVIGSGIGGLVCANLLAREGLGALLVEQHYMAGGYCSTFRRAGYTFDAATHFYPLLGNRETFTGRLLDDLGVTTSWVPMDPVDTFHLPDGTRFEVPADFDPYLQRLKRFCPEEAAGLDDFFGHVRRAYRLGLLAHFRRRRLPRLATYERLSVADVVERHIGDRELRLLLTADCAHWGSPPSRTSFVFDSMLRMAYFLGNYYPVGGSQAFADELARCFEERGGEILMSTRARRIDVTDGRVSGVELETTRGPLRGQRRVDADVVVSNADVRQTFEGLLGPDEVAPETIAAVRSLRPSYPCFLTHVGLRDVDPGTLADIQGYYWRDWDPDDVGGRALRCKIFAPTLYEPDLAPAGGHIVILQKVQDLDHDAVVDWEEHRRTVEEDLLRHLERVLPGVEEKIEVALSATALTSSGYTLNSRGAMLGWEMASDQLGEARPPIAGPVDGLYLVGHWTRPGGGVTPVIVSAVHAAEAVAEGREPTPWPAATDGLGNVEARDLQTEDVVHAGEPQ